MGLGGLGGKDRGAVKVFLFGLGEGLLGGFLLEFSLCAIIRHIA
jgi:hypothetical protein